jgi:tRNA A-37 threonylcarbamoyl transferase component Bud32
MADGEEEIIVCYACGAPMNIASVAPYSRVVCPDCKTENRVKKQFGPYILSRRHAIGGMSSVFVAHDETLGREVAIKILSEEYSNDEKRIAAFEEEARLTASFSHPNVVRVLTTGRAFGRLYIAMEFVPGGHFERQIMEKGKIPQTEILPLAIQVAEGLKGAQAAGLIHRDIKPGNILLDAEGNAKIVDFGLALVTKGGTATATEIWATPYYVPPEAIEGQAEDFRSDIYAFGATLYHALAGKPPCDEETMVTDKLREAKRRIVPLKRAAPELCDETCAVIDRAMAYEPAQRFASYDEMINGLMSALKAAHADATVDQHGVTKAERRAEQRRTERSRNFMLAGAAVVLAAALGTFIAVKGLGADEKETPPEKIRIVETEEDTDGEKPVDVAARYAQARGAMENGDFRKAEQSFAALLEDGAVQEPTRTWAGLQAVVAAMMEGRMDDARMRSQVAAKHLSSDPEGVGPDFRSVILPVLGAMDGPGFIDAEKPDSGGGNERFMGYLIAGLKNWEQGGLDQAVPFFHRIANERPLADDPIMAWYQKAIGAYLSDYEALAPVQSATDPETPEACREAIENLNEALTLLKTKGRARFNIRARQLDLEKLEKVLRNKPPRPDDDLPEEIESLAGSYSFRKIVDLLSGSSKTVVPGGKRESMPRVAKEALGFMDGLASSVDGKPVSVPLKLRDGADVSSVVISDEKKLMVKLPDGEIREISWQDFPPQELLTLHHALDDSTTSDEARLQRRISSVCFDWLAGDRKRARMAAEKFSGESEPFRERWTAISAGLPE